MNSKNPNSCSSLEQQFINDPIRNLQVITQLLEKCTKQKDVLATHTLRRCFIKLLELNLLDANKINHQDEEAEVKIFEWIVKKLHEYYEFLIQQILCSQPEQYEGFTDISSFAIMSIRTLVWFMDKEFVIVQGRQRSLAKLALQHCIGNLLQIPMDPSINTLLQIEYIEYIDMRILILKSLAVEFKNQRRYHQRQQNPISSERLTIHNNNNNNDDDFEQDDDEEEENIDNDNDISSNNDDDDDEDDSLSSSTTSSENDHNNISPATFNTPFQNNNNNNIDWTLYHSQALSLLLACGKPLEQPFQTIKSSSDDHVMSKSVPSKKLEKQYRKLYQRAWTEFLRMSTIPISVHLKIIPEIDQVMGNFPNPLLLADYLIDAFDGTFTNNNNDDDYSFLISLSALPSIFFLMKEHRLEYPDLYTRLYNMMNLDLFTIDMDIRSRFLPLIDGALKSSYLPHTLVAAFAKKISRIALFSPPCGPLFALPFVMNLITRHPECLPLIHRESAIITPTLVHDETDEKAAKLARIRLASRTLAGLPLNKQDDDGDGGKTSSIATTNNTNTTTTTMFIQDPYDFNCTNPTESHAAESSLWELKSLEHHYDPTVATLARSIFSNISARFKNPELPIVDFAQVTTEALFMQQLKTFKNKEKRPPGDGGESTTNHSSSGNQDVPIKKKEISIEAIPPNSCGEWNQSLYVVEKKRIKKLLKSTSPSTKSSLKLGKSLSVNQQQIKELGGDDDSNNGKNNSSKRLKVS
jgi:hypothetical protein